MSRLDDWRLTAFALGELDEVEAAEVAAWIREDPALQAFVEEVRGTAGALESALAAEPAPALSAAEESELAEAAEAAPPRRGLVRWAVAGSGFAAAAAVGLFFYTADSDAPAPAGVSAQVASKPAIATTGGPDPQSAAAPKVTITNSPPPATIVTESGATGSSAGPVADGEAVSAALRDRRASGSTAIAGEDADRAGAERGFVGANRQQIAHGGLVLDQLAYDPGGRDRFDHVAEGGFHDPTVDPLSTFSVDVDTASYSVVRRFLEQGRRPAPGAVRIEELINYFDYAYPPPVDGAPFSTNVEVASAPWNPDRRLVRIGLRGRVVERPRANLVFLLDVSGSMKSPRKLPLVQKAMTTLVANLHPDDRVAIVVYAGASGLVLPSTPAADAKRIRRALRRLRSGGSTNGGAGIQQAYWVAAQNYIPGGVNRVILATDGDFNVGVSDQSSLVAMIQEKAAGGVALTVLGFGMGNYNDSTLEKLADKGNGNYAYIDTEAEARKVLVDQLDATLLTIAKDVKLQVEFNPGQVAKYRLIGYENRRLAAQDFADDAKDAGEIGAGHTVTALYEVVPSNSAAGIPLKYQRRAPVGSAELLTVKLRYKAPEGDTSKLIEVPVVDGGARFAEASTDLRFAAAVAAFGMALRGSVHAEVDLAQVQRWAEDALGDDAFGYRGGFVELVQRARKIIR